MKLTQGAGSSYLSSLDRRATDLRAQQILPKEKQKKANNSQWGAQLAKELTSKADDLSGAWDPCWKGKINSQKVVLCLPCACCGVCTSLPPKTSSKRDTSCDSQSIRLPFLFVKPWAEDNYYGNARKKNKRIIFYSSSSSDKTITEIRGGRNIEHILARQLSFILIY